jgi:hypothetical protein
MIAGGRSVMRRFHNMELTKISHNDGFRRALLNHRNYNPLIILN